MENQERKKIRVRIVKSTSKKLWYRDRIGHEIEVFQDIRFDTFPEPEGQWYTLANRPRHFLRVEDCEVIPEESKPAGPIGREEGVICNRNGCPGKIVIVYDPERRCACHINPPCSRCMDSVLKCDQCGAEPMEEEVRETLAIPEEAPKMEPDETWPGFAGLQAYEQGDFPEGMIPFFMQGDLGKFEEMYFNAITLLSMDSREVCTNLLSAIWHFGNDQWRQGCDYGRKNPAREASPNDGQEMPPSPYNRLKKWADTGEKERIFSVMVAAAEYLKEEWEKLVDDAGCGPANLCHRLENCIAELYPGYTAGAFAEICAKVDGLKSELKESRKNISAARAHVVKLNEEVAVAEREAKADREALAALTAKIRAAISDSVQCRIKPHELRNRLISIICGRDVPEQGLRERATLEELVGKLSEESAKWEHRGRKAEFVLQEVRKAGNWLQEMKNTNPDGRDLHLFVRSHLADLDRAFGFLESPLPDPQEWADRAIKAETRLKHADSMLDVFRRKNMMIRRQVLQARDSFYETVSSPDIHFKILVNAALDHLSTLDRIANLPSTEENLQPVNEAKDYATGGSLAPGCSNDLPAAAGPCGEVAGRIDRIEFKKGEVFIAEALSEDGETLWGAAADTLEELLEGMQDERRVRITKETAEAELKAWAAQEGAKPSPEKVWKEFQMKGPGGNPAEDDYIFTNIGTNDQRWTPTCLRRTPTWWDRLKKRWRLIREGWAAARDINTNGPSDQ